MQLMPALGTVIVTPATIVTTQQKNAPWVVGQMVDAHGIAIVLVVMPVKTKSA